MLIDTDFCFSDGAQALATGGATVGTTTGFNVINMGAARNFGVGTPLYIVVIVTTALTHGGSMTSMTVDLQADSTTTFTPDGSQRVGSLAPTAAAGTTLIVAAQPNVINYQYWQLAITGVGANPTAGAVNAFVTSNIQAWAAFADSLTIS